MTGHVKGARRKAVEAVRDAAESVLAAENHAEAYFAYLELGRAVNALDDLIAKTVKRGAA